MKNSTLVQLFLMMTIITSIFIQPINGALLTDINGSYTYLGDEGAVSGGGLTLLWDMPRYFDNDKVLFYINSSYGYGKKNKDKPSEIELTYVPLSAGFELKYQISRLPLYLTGSAGAGVSFFKKESPLVLAPQYTRIDSAFGPYADFTVGFNFVLTQNVAVFARTGYQKSFYHDDKILSPSGFQFTSGIRIPMFGSTRTLGGVDDEYEASEPIHNYAMNSSIRKSVRAKTLYGFYPGVIVPFGEFGDISDFGYGGMFTLSRTNLFFRNFEGGVSPGFYYMHAKDKDYQTMMIAPLYLTAGYRIGIGSSLIIKPVISAGGAYIDAKYIDRDKILSEQDSHLMTVEPSAKAGLFAEYILTDSLTISLGCEYGAIIEKNGILHFVVADAGINYSF